MPQSAYVVRIPRLTHLDGELARIEALPRSEAVAALRALRQREMANISARQSERLAETTGQDVAAELTALCDAVTACVVRRAAVRAGAPVGWQEQAGVFAVGGYGRAEMCPNSDLDLLWLSTGSRQPEWFQPMWTELNALLWDVKFAVGASQRSLGELSRLIEEDFVTATALLEQRPLVSGAAPAAALGEALERFRRRRAQAFLRYKIEELEKRRSQAGASLFLMEPNLKSNPGGLRDVQFLRNAAFIAAGSRNLIALCELESITRPDLDNVVATNDHLLTVRCLQHFHHQRKQDVWQLSDQVRIAHQLGYTDLSRLRAVEQLMRRHYAMVLHVHQVCDLAISRLHATGHLGRRPILIRSRKPISDGLVAVQGQAYLSDPGFWRLGDAGARLLRGCRAAQVAGVRLSFELQRAIKANLQVVGDEDRCDPALGRVLLALLGDAGRVQPILKDMHSAGLLGTWLPEFGNLTCHMQFDSWHQYTVDEHTLIAMGHLDRLARGEEKGLPGMDRIFPGLPRKDLLGLALLLHDMGKYMGRGHVARGAIMMGDVSRRLGLSDDEADLVYFLVESHVILSDATRMRDFQDPAFLKPFATRIGSRERLDYLYCLTWADAKAVGEGVMTGWQESLLGSLHAAVARSLEGREGPAEGSRERLLHTLAAGGIPTGRAEDFLASLPDAYHHQVPADEALRHARVLARSAVEGIGLEREPGDRYTSLFAALPDRHGLLADIAATLSGHGFDIMGARAWITAAPATVLYSFRLSTVYPARLQEEETWTRLRRDLLAVSRQELDPRSLIERRRQSIPASRPADSGFDDPAVKIEQLSSDAFTVVDVMAKDQVGLLSRLCRAISDSGHGIGFTSINTLGDVAVDVFYVHQDGRKLTTEEGDALRGRLIRELGL